MTTTLQKLTFADYLARADSSESRCELVDGELVPMSLGTGQHGAILYFLVRQLETLLTQTGQPWLCLPGLVGIRSPCGRRWDTCRILDITVLSLEQWDGMREREAVIGFDEPPPFLVVEVASPSTKADDYRSKRAEYGLLEIPEYWIVDPLERKVTVCTLDRAFYDSTLYQDSDRVRSSLFPDFNLTAAQVVAAQLS